MGIITLSEREQRRAEVVARAAAGELTSAQVGQLLNIGDRQARRLVANYRAHGLASVAHGNKARQPANRTDGETVERIKRLAGPDGVYADFNTAHLCEALSEQEGVQIGRSTLDRLLRQEGLRKVRRPRTRRVFRRRERYAREGELLQIDGSPHDWLEGRAGKMCLMGAVDDATGKIVHLRFWPTESLAAYLTLFREVALSYGLPMAYYHDKHTILRSPKTASLLEELAGQKPMSQAQKALDLLGVEGIAANTPQAKGRVERMWRTLQDRLIKEMRLAGISSMEAANAFLARFIERYNARFALPAANSEAAWVALPRDADLAYYFAARESRVVRQDHTLAWKGTTLQIRRGRGEARLAGRQVNVHTDPQGAVYIYDGKTRLEYDKLPEAPVTRQAKPMAAPPAEPMDAPCAKPAATRKPSAKQRGWAYAQT